METKKKYKNNNENIPGNKRYSPDGKAFKIERTL
jgi:hypothetical protein